MFRALAILALSAPKRALARESLPFSTSSSSCSLFSAPEVYADGSRSYPLSATSECLGVDYAGSVTSDRCDGSNRRRWSSPDVTGGMHNIGTGTCLGASGATPCSVPAPVQPSVTSASSSASPASLAFDGKATTKWVSAPSYGPDGLPAAGGLGEWLQADFLVPVVLTGYELSYGPEPAPASKRRPRSHVLLGAPTPSGPWSTVGAASGAAGISLHSPRTRSAFSIAGLAAFSSYRLVVTAVDLGSDGRAALAGLSLLSANHSARVAPWSGPLLRTDPWAPVAVTTGTVNGSYDGTYAGALALARGAQNASSAAIGSGAVRNVAGGGCEYEQPAVAVVTTVAYFSFLATRAFTQTVTGSANVTVYDLAGGGAACESLPCEFAAVAGHAYVAVSIRKPGTTSWVGLLCGVQSAAFQSAALGPAAPPSSSAPGPIPPPPTTVSAVCSVPYFVLNRTALAV